jgi:hypothetical protein
MAQTDHQPEEVIVDRWLTGRRVGQADWSRPASQHDYQPQDLLPTFRHGMGIIPKIY